MRSRKCNWSVIKEYDSLNEPLEEVQHGQEPQRRNSTVIAAPSLLEVWSGLSQAVKLSVVLQAAALPALVVPGAWPWVIAWLLTQHSILSVAGTIPRSTLLGANRTRILDQSAVALTFDDGPDPDITPKVLELLSERGLQATFFLIGARARAHPTLVRQIVEAGHGVENHTQSHSSWFCTFSPSRLSAEITQAQEAVIATGTPPPSHFRAPAGVRSPWLQPVLKHYGLQLTSWSRRGFDTSQSDPSRVLGRLTKNLQGGEILLLHDGNAGATAEGVPMVLEILPTLLDEIERLGLRVRPLRVAIKEC